MKKSIRFLALALALVMMLALCACGPKTEQGPGPVSNPGAESQPGTEPSQSGNEPSGEASGTFKLGGIGPMTGGAAQYGMAAMTGAQIAVDEINALGGPVQFEFNAQDDVNVADTAVNAYNILKDWGMQVLVGAVTTTPCISVSQEAYNDRIFCLTPSASSTDVTAGKDNMYQMCFTDPNQGLSGAEYVKANFPDAKIAVIYKNDDAYSQGIRDAFYGEMKDSIVYEGTFTEDTQTNFSVQVTAAKDAGADVVYLPMYYQPATVILNQAKAIGYAPTFIGVDGMDGILDQENFDASLAEGVLVMSPFAASSTDDRTVNFVAKYQEKLGQLPNQFAADGYDCVYAIYEAIQAAGLTADMSTADICEALIATFSSDSFTFTGLTGADQTWSANGEVTKVPMAFLIKDGVYTTP